MQMILVKLKAVEPRFREALWFTSGLLAGAYLFRVYYYYTYIKF